MCAQRNSQSPPALLIDALGTLVALEPPAGRLRDGLARRFGIDVTEAQAQRALAAEIAFYRAHMGEGRDAESLWSLRRHCARVLGEALPDPAAVADLDALTEALLDSLHFSVYPDARPALLRARSRGARVVVVSNWDISLLEVLERVGLAPLLHGVVTSAAVGARKPAAAIFEHALALAATSPEAALHVGDSLDEDVAGALACGIGAVLLRRDGRPGPEGMATIPTLDQLTWPEPV